MKWKPFEPGGLYTCNTCTVRLAVEAKKEDWERLAHRLKAIVTGDNADIDGTLEEYERLCNG